ncbi:MAG: hypothetical protein V7752_04020 [Halopseudomonas sp.]
MIFISQIAKARDYKLAVLIALIGPVFSSPLLADTNQEHMARFHGEQYAEASAEDLKMIRLAAIGYGAKQGLKSMGVDYKQLKHYYREITEYALTPKTSLVLEYDRVNLKAKFLDGSVMTELSGQSDGEVGLAVKLAF